MDYGKELLAALKTSEWMTAIELATILNCSTRTVKKYMSRLKEEYPYDIASSSKGYKLTNLSIASSPITKQEETGLPQTQEDRISYIIKELIINSRTVLTLDDLTDLLFISESTLRNDLMKTKKVLDKYNCTLEVEKGKLHITGKEQDIRSIISDIIRQESTSNFFDLGNLSSFFPEYDIRLIRNTLYKIISSYNLKISDIALTSLTRHLVITMYRLQDKDTHLPSEAIEYEHELTEQIVEEISSFIYSHYQVKLDAAEEGQLELFLYAKVFQGENIEKLSSGNEQNVNALNIELYKFIDNMVDKVNTTFYIDLSDEDFKKRFALHLQGLIFRSKNNLLAANPLTDSIKLQVPFLYEISVFIYDLIRNEFEIDINDDEITYIVFHIGSYLEEDSKQFKNHTVLGCTLFFPNIGLSTLNYNKIIASSFSDTLSINKLVTSFNDFDSEEEGTLLITSATDVVSNYSYIVTVSPLLTKYDLTKINETITKIQDELELDGQTSNLLTIFSKKIFRINTEFTNKWDAINFMCNELLEQGYINNSYIQEVIAREKLSSTAFGKFAIPHSMNMNAAKTGVYVLIQKKPIKWDDNEVNIVFLFAFSNKNRTEFRKSFEQVTNKFLQTKSLTKIISSKNFNDFISYLLD